MNRTLKDATVKRYYYQTHQQLKEHMQDLWEGIGKTT